MTSELTASQEDYLETILGLIAQTGAARVRDIADRLRVAKSSVSVALRSLAKRKLVHYEPYQLVRLTDDGQTMAERILRRHETISSFFTDTLGVDRLIADANACRIEHAIGDGVMQRLACFMQFMASSAAPARSLPDAFRTHCAQQRRRGDCQGCAVGDQPASCAVSPRGGAGAAATLADLRPGQKARVVRAGGAAALRRRLVEMGITRGSTVSIVRVAPLGDPVEIRVRGYSLALRAAEAREIEVEGLA